MYKTKATPEEKIKTIEAYLSGEGSLKSWSSRLGITYESFRSWVRVYQAFGPDGLLSKSKASAYSAETKEAAVEAFLSGRASQAEICREYKILSRTQLQDWIKQYNGHKKLRSTGGTGSGIYMAKGRSTAYEERIGIVGFCLENGKDYVKTIEKYGVSYQQIYLWVRKYEEHGIEGLLDKRGKRKGISEMTESERLHAENRLLQAKLKQAKMEIALLKKVRELERGDR